MRRRTRLRQKYLEALSSPRSALPEWLGDLRRIGEETDYRIRRIAKRLRKAIGRDDGESHLLFIALSLFGVPLDDEFCVRMMPYSSGRQLAASVWGRSRRNSGLATKRGMIQRAKATSHDFEMQALMIEALASTFDPRLAPVIEHFLDSPSALVRDRAAEHMSFVGGSSSPKLAALVMNDPSMEVRYSALYSIAYQRRYRHLLSRTLKSEETCMYGTLSGQAAMYLEQMDCLPADYAGDRA